MTAQILDITPEQYHADPCEEPSLSSGIAKLIVEKSPAHAWLEHPRFGGQSRAATKAMDRGSFIHRMLLGKGVDVVEVCADNYRTKAAREARDGAHEAGKVPMLSRELDELNQAAEVIRGKLASRGYELKGRSEVAVTWRTRAFLSDHEIQCRAMFDHLPGGPIGWDLKTIHSADPATITRRIYDGGLDIQWAHYSDALRSLFPRDAGRERFEFLFCEIEAPYAVTPVRLDGQYRALGEARWNRATQTWRECIRTGVWPEYANEAISVSPPAWAMKDLYAAE